MTAAHPDLFSPRVLCVNSVDTLEKQRALGFLGRHDLQRVPFSLPFDWKRNPLRDNNWMFLVSSWRMMDPMISRYFETNNSSLLLDIQDIALDWADYQQRNEPNQWTWYDMATGIRALRLAFLVDRHDRGEFIMSPKVRTLVRQHIDALLDESRIAINNHGIFQMAGLLALAPLSESPVSTRRFAEKKLREIADDAFTVDGINKEHSPAYHRFVYQTFAKFRPLYERVPGLADSVRKAADNEAWLTMPSGHFAAVGDTDNGSFGQPLRHVAKADTFRVNEDHIAIKFFRNSGYAMCRSLPESDATFALFVTASKFSDTHKHADELSFVYENLGEQIFVDGGKFAYEYSEMRSYFLSAQAHSTISIDNDDVLPSTLTDAGNLLTRVTPMRDRVSITGALTRPGLFSQRRQIDFAPRRFVVVSDKVRAPTLTPFRSRLKFSPRMTLEVDGTRIRATTPFGQVIHVEANAPIHLGEGYYSPSYKEVVRCPELSITANATVAELQWTVTHDS